jgi:CIC family chloride channel protein
VDSFRLDRMALLGSVIGILSLVAAFLLTRSIGFFLNLVWFHRFAFTLVEPHNSPFAGRWWTIFLPMIGAAVIGLMLKYGSKAIGGHGIPEAMEAVMYKESKLHPKVAILKPISAAISIGTGGPFGAEGPVIMTGGAIGSIVGQLIRTSHAERKVLLACGAAAGMVAIFGTPLAAIFLVIELLLFEFSTRAFIPVALAVGVAAGARSLLMDASGPLFPIVATSPLHLPQLPWYLLFGIIAGLVAAGMTWVLYWVEDLYEQIPLLTFATRPILGAFAVGLVGVFFPRSLGIGYDAIAGLLSNQFTLGLVLSILCFKFIAWTLALGSGTSGGVLAPILMIGGALGSTLGHLAAPFSAIPPGMAALVVMAALFGSSTRATLTAILFAAEVTGHYEALVPLLITCATANYVALHLLPYTIMTGRLIRHGRRVVQDYAAPIWDIDEADPEAANG